MDKKSFDRSLFEAISSYIEQNYVMEPAPICSNSLPQPCDTGSKKAAKITRLAVAPLAQGFSDSEQSFFDASYEKPPKSALKDVLELKEQTFSEKLFALIDEKGFSDVEVYKRGNIDRKLFSKIRSDREYQPSKLTVVKLAIALCLTLDETLGFMSAAGFTLSCGVKFDLIIRYFIERGNFDILQINEALYAFDQLLLL